MRLATLAEGRDGALVLVDASGEKFLPGPVATMQAALESWRDIQSALKEIDARLRAGEGDEIGGRKLAAPLPRAWQWLDGSAFQSHGRLMEKAFNIAPIETPRPLMYQGISDHFLGPNDDVALPSEEDGIDFEGEFGVIVDDVPMGVSVDEAIRHIKLIVQINDWSLRAIAPLEMKTGFGWVQAKPACSAAPFALTPDELGSAWAEGRVGLDLLVDWNGKRFGAANGAAMAYGFHDLIAHAARTRRLCAGTIIGSGTVSNENYREVGSSCIAEVRGIEIVDHGAPRTAFMRFGDTVRMEARLGTGSAAFGIIEQKVVRAG